MALLNDKIRDVDADFSGSKAPLVGFKAVRRPSALVTEILRKSNNFYVTAVRGFEAIGIDPAKVMETISPKLESGKMNPNFQPDKLMAFVPKVAEAIVLLTCDEDSLDVFDDDPKAFRSAVRNFMKDYTSAEILAQVQAVQEEFNKINRSTATLPEDESSAMEASASKEKKPGRRG